MHSVAAGSIGIVFAGTFGGDGCIDGGVVAADSRACMLLVDFCFSRLLLLRIWEAAIAAIAVDLSWSYWMFHFCLLVCSVSLRRPCVFVVAL